MKIVIKKKFLILILVILLQFAIHQSYSQIITSNESINLQQNEVYLQDVADLYEFVAKNITFPSGYPSNQINQPYTLLSETKNNQVTSNTLANFNYANAIYSIALGYQLKSNSNNLDIILTYYRTYINPKNGIIKRDELNNRKIQSIDPKYTPNYTYGSMFNSTAGFVSYYYINTTSQIFQKSVYFFSYLEKIGINLIQVFNIDLFKHSSILGPSGVIYLIQYRFEQFQLYKFKDQEPSLIDLTKSFKDIQISKYVADQGKYYFGISLQNSTVYCASVDFSNDKLIIRSVELPQYLSNESEVQVQRMNDYFYIIISDSHQISVLQYQSIGLLDFGTMNLVQNKQLPFGFGVGAFPTFISQNNFIFIKDRSIHLVDLKKSRVIYQQSFDAGLNFYQLDYYQNQFIMYFLNSDGQGKITYLSKQIQIKAPSLIIQGQQSQFSLLISSSNFPFTFNVILTVNIPSQQQVTFEDQAILITQIMDTLVNPTQFFAVEPYVEGPDLSLEVSLPQTSQQLIKSAKFVKIQSLKTFQQFNIDETFTMHQTDYYFASIAQRQKVTNQKTQNKHKSFKGQQKEISEQNNKENQNVLQDKIFYEIIALLPVSNSDGSGNIKIISNKDQFDQKIDQIDNSGSFTLQQNPSSTNYRIYLPFVNKNIPLLDDQELILNYFDVQCNQNFIFASDLSANVLFTSCGSQLQMVSYVPSSDSNQMLSVTQLYSITIDPTPYKKLLTNRGLLFIYSDTSVAAFDYINFNYFPFAVQIPQISPNQQVFLFKCSFIIISPLNPQEISNDSINIQAAQYSYNGFQQALPTLQRYLQIDQQHSVNSSYQAIAIRNDIEYLLLSQSQQTEWYNIYRISNNAYSQNQLYSTIQIPQNSIPVINSDIICILQDIPAMKAFISNVSCSQIMEHASIVYDLLITENQFNENLSFSAQIILSNSLKNSQTYYLITQRNAELKNMLVNENSLQVKDLKEQFNKGLWDQSTIFTLNDQKIMNTCTLGWYSSFQNCIVKNRINSIQATPQQLSILNSQNKQTIINYTKNYIHQDRKQMINRKENRYNNSTSNKAIIQQDLQRILQETFFSKKQNDELQNNQFKYFNILNNNNNYINKFEYKQIKIMNEKIEQNENKHEKNRKEESKESNKTEFSVEQITIFSFLFDQAITVSQSLTNIMTLLYLDQNYYGCSFMDDNFSVTNRRQGVFYVDLYVLCPQSLDKYHLMITTNNKNEYQRVSISNKKTYSTQYNYDPSPFQKLLSINQDIVLTKYNGDKYFLRISDTTFYIDQTQIPYSTMIGINAVSTLAQKIFLTFFENQILYVQVIVTEGVLNEYIDISYLLEENYFSISSSDTINSIDQYSDTQFRIGFSNSYIYDVEVYLNSDNTVSLRNVSLYYYRDAFSKHLSGFKGSKYNLFYGFKDNQYILTLYSNANSKQNQYLIESMQIIPFNTNIQGIRCVYEINPNQIVISFSNQQILTFDISDTIKFTVKQPQNQIPQQGIQLLPINQLDDLNNITLLLKKQPPKPTPTSNSQKIDFSFALYISITLFSLFAL